MKAIDRKAITGFVLEDILCKAGVDYDSINLNLTYVAGYGGASKITYVSPKTGKKMFVLQVSEMYCADDFGTECWYFTEDFTEKQADAFLTSVRHPELA